MGCFAPDPRALAATLLFASVAPTMEQESVARLMKAEMDAKKEVDDAKKGASHPQPCPQSFAHSEPSAGAFVLRAPCRGAGRAGGARARGAPLGAGRRVFDLRGARTNT